VLSRRIGIRSRWWLNGDVVGWCSEFEAVRGPMRALFYIEEPFFDDVGFCRLQHEMGLVVRGAAAERRTRWVMDDISQRFPDSRRTCKPLLDDCTIERLSPLCVVINL